MRPGSTGSASASMTARRPVDESYNWHSIGAARAETRLITLMIGVKAGTRGAVLSGSPPCADHRDAS